VPQQYNTNQQQIVRCHRSSGIQPLGNREAPGQHNATRQWRCQNPLQQVLWAALLTVVIHSSHTSMPARTRDAHPAKHKIVCQTKWLHIMHQAAMPSYDMRRARSNTNRTLRERASARPHTSSTRLHQAAMPYMHQVCTTMTLEHAMISIYGHARTLQERASACPHPQHMTVGLEFHCSMAARCGGVYGSGRRPKPRQPRHPGPV
jgi:hypothetical protein